MPGLCGFDRLFDTAPVTYADMGHRAEVPPDFHDIGIPASDLRTDVTLRHWPPGRERNANLPFLPRTAIQ